MDSVQIKVNDQTGNQNGIKRLFNQKIDISVTVLGRDLFLSRVPADAILEFFGDLRVSSSPSGVLTTATTW